MKGAIAMASGMEILNQRLAAGEITEEAVHEKSYSEKEKAEVMEAAEKQSGDADSVTTAKK